DRLVLAGDVIALARKLIAMLDQQPIVALATVAVMFHAHEHKTALQLLTREREFQLSLAQSSVDILRAFRHPESSIPQHHGAAAILALGNRPFKVTIVERVVLHLHS